MCLDSLERGLRNIIGDRGVDAMFDCYDYCVNKPNPIIQFFYLLVAGGGFVVYVWIGMRKYCPGPFLADYHKYTGSILMITCYYSFYRACTTDPGIIKDQTHAK